MCWIAVSRGIRTARSSTAAARRYTAAELAVVANRVANTLPRWGVRHGSTVATILENGAAAVLSWFAIHKLGAIAVPVNTALKGSLLRHQLADADTAVVIVQEDLAERPVEILDSIGTVRHLVVVGDPAPAARSGIAAAVHAWTTCWMATGTRPARWCAPPTWARSSTRAGTTGPSKGWKTTRRVPDQASRPAASSAAAPESQVACMSCPQACMTGNVAALRVDAARGTRVGEAGLLLDRGARRCRHAALRPAPHRCRRMPSTPVRPMPVCTS